MKKRYLLSGAVGLAVVLLSGCGKENTFAPPPPPSVTVSLPVKGDVTVYQRFPGQLRAVENIEIRARVKGYLQEIHFKDGQMVKKDQKLFTIEKSTYEATVAAAKADLSQAEAQLNLAKTPLDRMEKAYQTRAISEIEYLAAKDTKAAAEAGVLAQKARVHSAELDLSYTEVTSPIVGRISRHLVSTGNLVGNGQSTLLAKVVSMDPVHVYFNVDERTMLSFLKRVGGIRKDGKASGTFKVKLALSDGSVYPKEGVVDYVGNEVDTSTGTLEIRASFPNPENKLVPGLFGKIMLPNPFKDALRIPARAIQQDMVGSYLLVVNDKQEVESRYVKVGPPVEADSIILEGLKPDERVIVNGLSRARPGIKVTATDAKDKAKEKADNPDKPAPKPDN
jgi:RND family efflux transporter MFP subunit